MNSDAAEAALGLLRLSPLNNSNVAQPLIPQKRNQIPSPLSVQPVSTGKPPPTSTAASTITTSHLTQSNNLPPSDTDAISCICGFLFDDGFSIACDVCSRWCHAACFDIVEGEVPEEWLCWNCDPRPVDRDRAVRLQKQRVAEAQVREKEREKDKDKDKDKDKGRKRDRQNSPLPRRRVSAAAIEGSGNAKKKRRASIISPSTVQPLPNNHNHTTPSQHGEDEPVNIDEPWTLSYVPITRDVVSPEVHTRLRKQAQAWRGVTAISSPPANPHRTQIQSVPPTTSPSQMHTNPLVRPPTYCLHTTEPVSSSSYIAPYTCAITPSASYLADPLNSYAHLGMPKPFVHLLGPPLDVALDARVVGDEGRFARNGCRPNAVLRPVLCSKAKDKERDRKEVGRKHTGERDETDDDDETLTFGVFALRDLKANEEVVLGWEWDDGNAVHSLPALIESPHMFSTHHLTHLRAQMTSILHALSSTFTTCACGARARDCVLNIMAQFVDGELDAASTGHSIQEPSGYTLNGISTPANGNGVRQGQGQAGVVDTCEGSSSDKENWGHTRGGGGGGVGLGIQINTSIGSPNNNSLNGSTTPSALSTPGRKVDFGPLIGTKRGFKTREKVPFGGGVGGVEMVPSSSPSGFVGPVHFGPGLSSGGRSSVWSSSLDPTVGPSGSNWRTATSSTGLSRTALSSARSGARVKTYDRKGKGRATTEVDEDVDVDVEGDTPNPHVMDVDEEKIPPKMRKRWMHSVSTSATHDRDKRASLPNGRNPTSLLSLPESRGKGPPVSSGHSPPTLASATDWRNPALLSVDSPTPLSADSPSPDSTVNEMDVDVNGVSPDAREMPPPPMPAALDPTTISSVAFASVSPSTTFSKLSLLSPVPPDARSGSPSVFGMQVPNSARRVVLSSPPPYKSSNRSSTDLDTLGADVVINPPSPNPSVHDNSPPHRVRFASPEVLQGQPSLKASHHALMKQEQATLPLVEDKTDPESPSTGSAAPDGQPDGASHQIESVSPRLGDVQLPETSTPVPSNPTPTSAREMTSSPSPSRDSTREPSPPVPKVKMSLKDFALRKKKQREEMAKERVRECESPIVPDAGLLEESGDEGMHVDDDGQHDGLDEGTVEARDCDGQGCGTPAEDVARSDVGEVQDMVMDDGVQTIVKDEPLAGMDRMLEDPPPNGRQRYESEPPLLSPRSPIASTRIVNGVEKAESNGQTANPASLKAKIEVLETAIPSTLMGTDDRITPSAPEPPPPPLYKGTDTNLPLPKTCAPASHSQFPRPPQEDGEITSSSPPKSLNFFPRSYTPPTQPRSFQTSHPSPPSFPHAPSSSTSYRAPPPPRTPLSSSTSTSLNGSSRPLPSGPRALRIGSRPTYTQSSSPSSRSYSGSQYIPRGPSADRDRHDRDRLDWERDRVWRPGPPRSRGRSSNSGWGR